MCVFQYLWQTLPLYKNWLPSWRLLAGSPLRHGHLLGNASRRGKKDLQRFAVPKTINRSNSGSSMSRDSPDFFFLDFDGQRAPRAQNGVWNFWNLVRPKKGCFHLTPPCGKTLKCVSPFRRSPLLSHWDALPAVSPCSRARRRFWRMWHSETCTKSWKQDNPPNRHPVGCSITGQFGSTSMCAWASLDSTESTGKPSKSSPWFTSPTPRGFRLFHLIVFSGFSC